MIRAKAEIVTKPKPVVTKLSPSVTKAQGRPRVYASAAERQKAYRERRQRKEDV